MRAFFLTLILLVPVSLSAQESRQVQCRFLSFGGEGNETEVLAAAEKGKEVTCPLSSSQISSKIPCTVVANKIPFLSSKNQKLLATAKIPPNINSALLIFIQLPKTPKDPNPAWKILVIEDSPKNFPAGGAFVANFYSGNIRFIIGEHKAKVKSGSLNGFAMPKERDAFNMAPVIFEFQDGDKWFTANESALRFLPEMRYLIFAYVDPQSGRPRINTYQDFEVPGES